MDESKDYESRIKSLDRTIANSPNHSKVYQKAVKSKLKLLKEKESEIKEKTTQKEEEIALLERFNRNEQIIKLVQSLAEGIDKNIAKYEEMQSKEEEDTLEYIVYGTLINKLLERKLEILSSGNKLLNL